MGGGEQDDIVSIVGSSPYDGDKRQIGRTPLSSTLSGEARRSRRLELQIRHLTHGPRHGSCRVAHPSDWNSLQLRLASYPRTTRHDAGQYK